MGSKQRLEVDEESSMEQKTWQVYSFGQKNVFRLHLNESRGVSGGANSKLGWVGGGEGL